MGPERGDGPRHGRRRGRPRRPPHGLPQGVWLIRYVHDGPPIQVERLVIKAQSGVAAPRVGLGAGYRACGAVWGPSQDRIRSTTANDNQRQPTTTVQVRPGVAVAAAGQPGGRTRTGPSDRAAPAAPGAHRFGQVGASMALEMLCGPVSSQQEPSGRGSYPVPADQVSGAAMDHGSRGGDVRPGATVT